MNYIELVIQVQNADLAARRTAFDALTQMFQEMAYYVAFNHLQDSYLAEDAVQEAFLTAYLRISQLRDPVAFPSWLRRIVLTQADRMVRGKHPTLEPLEARLDLASDTPTPEAALEEQEVIDGMQVAIRALPAHERDVTEGFYIKGESQQELAERLKIPVTTVKKRLQYARQHLRLLAGGLNAAFDQALADIWTRPQPQRQPVYLYQRHPDQDDSLS